MKPQSVRPCAVGTIGLLSMPCRLLVSPSKMVLLGKFQNFVQL